MKKGIYRAETFGELTTTLTDDFDKAERAGAEAVKGVYGAAFAKWKGDYRYLTNLVMVLNCKIWEHFEAKERDWAAIYDGLWRKADAYAVEHLRGAEARYFFGVTRAESGK